MAMVMMMMVKSTFLLKTSLSKLKIRFVDVIDDGHDDGYDDDVNNCDRDGYDDGYDDGDSNELNDLTYELSALDDGGGGFSFVVVECSQFMSS